MQTSDTIIVYRGPEVKASSLCQIVMELLGGHLRPDASLALHFSAPIRVNRLAASRSPDPLAGTVRAIHLQRCMISRQRVFVNIALPTWTRRHTLDHTDIE